MSSDSDDDRLIRLAREVRANAYAPFSKFSVGAALLADNGKTYTGVNVENSSFGLTICAERTAAGAAVSDGARRFDVIAVASPGGHSPCGACRQFLSEFTDGSLRVLLVDSEKQDGYEELKLAELLPKSFRFGG